MYLSNGLQAVAVGSSGTKVVLADGTESELPYHENCDGGAAFATADGGHIYVSNSEIGTYPDALDGGVYALTFDGQNQLTGYSQLLSNTAYNCHGGETPWGTWVSCEEYRDYGRCWQGECDEVNYTLDSHVCIGDRTIDYMLTILHHPSSDIVRSGSHRSEGTGAHRHHRPVHGRIREYLCRRLDFIYALCM